MIEVKVETEHHLVLFDLASEHYAIRNGLLSLKNRSPILLDILHQIDEVIATHSKSRL